MSAAIRCQTCARCGGLLDPTQPTSVEPLVDGMVRYVAVHWDCSTSPAVQRAHDVARERN